MKKENKMDEIENEKKKEKIEKKKIKNMSKINDQNWKRK